MLLKYKTLAFIVIFATLACSCGRLTSSERKLIGSASEGPMRLLSVDKPADSLFLRRSAEPVSRGVAFSRKFAVLKDRMLATVTDSLNDGVGIAAPQVGIGRRLIAVQRFDKSGEPFEFYLNPEIIYYSDEQGEGMEGCLSVPLRSGQVMRPREIVVRYNAADSFDLAEERVFGYTAVIFQHEIDHLNGTLFIDKTHSDYRRSTVEVK